MPEANGQFVDLLITDRDITLDNAGMPVYVDDRASIAQDIQHMIMESEILIQLIAERSPMKWAGNLIKLETMIEDDVRIIPGSVIMERDKADSGKILLTANTILGPLGWILTNTGVELNGS